jgi:hypothetical protein
MLPKVKYRVLKRTLFATWKALKIFAAKTLKHNHQKTTLGRNVDGIPDPNGISNDANYDLQDTYVLGLCESPNHQGQRTQDHRDVKEDKIRQRRLDDNFGPSLPDEE